MTDNKSTGAIAWMAKNPVASNLLMLFLLIGGILTSFYIKQEVFPPFEVDTVYISVPYPGTSPEEVEQGIILAVEEAVRDIEGVKRINSTAREGLASVFVDLRYDVDQYKALQDVKNAIDRIRTMPEEAERPNVELITNRMSVITVVLYGELNEHVLRGLAERVREEILQRPDVTNVELAGVRPLEISIEVPEEKLRAYNLTLPQIARIVRAASVDYSAGGVKAEGGEILLRVQERKDFGKQYGNIPVVSAPDGAVVRLADIAEIKDGFEDTEQWAFYNGQPAIMLKVTREGNQTPVQVAGSVLEYLDDLKNDLPKGVNIATFDNRAEHYRERVDMLLKNALIGLILVMALLGLFLNRRLAFWVTMGIPVSFLGALLFLPSFDVSINMISLFAFIMALGIVVDDAIVVGENIFTLRREGMDRISASIVGAKQVAVPVVFAVLTNCISFLPLAFLEGVMGKVFKVVPIVVILVFSISLIEALFILPAHLGHVKNGKEDKGPARMGRVQTAITSWLDRVINNYYQPLLIRAVKRRYITFAVGIALLTIVIGYIAGGRMPLTFMPKTEADVVLVGLELPYGSPVEQTEKIQQKLVKAAIKVLDKHGGKKVYDGIFTQIGESNVQMADWGAVTGGHAANVRVFMVKSDQRDFTGEQFSQWWRKEMGDIPGVEKIYFQPVEIGPPVGSPVDVELSHRDNDTLEAAAAELAEMLKNYSAAKDIDDGFAPGKPQLDFRLKPVAYGMGLTPAEVGAQVRGAFYGSEALRLQRGRNEVKVMVRLPYQDRRRETSVEDLLIRTPRGGEIPLSEAAEVIEGRAYTKINRTDGRRTLNVTSDVVPISAKSEVIESIGKNDIPRLQAKYPGLTYTLGGESRETSESMQSLMRNFIIALIAIFVVLGIVFRSYIQPLIIMVSIPFGLVGAVIGHLIMGFNLSVVSMLGMTALSGVVLNDALVLIDYANERRRQGADSMTAIVDAGVRRFRPIMLTTLTTFFGLMPMILETSFQARILVPMAVSLGYGILFSTAVILLLVPALYIMLEDAKRVLGMETGMPDNTEDLSRRPDGRLIGVMNQSGDKPLT